MAEESKAPTAEAPAPKTLAQLQVELQTWLDQNHLQVAVMAHGLRTGQFAPIEDFMPATHEATFVVQRVQP